MQISDLFVIKIYVIIFHMRVCLRGLWLMGVSYGDVVTLFRL